MDILDSEHDPRESFFGSVNQGQLTNRYSTDDRLELTSHWQLPPEDSIGSNGRFEYIQPVCGFAFAKDTHNRIGHCEHA